MSTISVLDETTVLAKLDRTQVLGALETAFSGLMNGKSVQPTQTVTVFPDGRGDCIFYPGALLDLGLVGVKVSPYLQELADSGSYPVTAYTLLLSASTGRPILVCDSYALTAIRTAATTALAVKYLRPAQSEVLALIGSGKVAREHLRYALTLQSWEQVRVYSPTAVGNEERQALVRGAAAGVELSFSSSAQVAVEGADVVMLCTSSGSEVIQYDWLQPKSLVTSISTNSPGAHEVLPSTLGNFDVYCDYRATAPLTAGEMKIAIEAGSWNETSIVADLPELVSGAEVRNDGRPRFFRSTGLGIEDLAIAGLLVG